MLTQAEQESYAALHYEDHPILIDALTALTTGAFSVTSRSITLSLPATDQSPAQVIKIPPEKQYKRVRHTMSGLNLALTMAEQGKQYRELFNEENEKFEDSIHRFGHDWGYGTLVYYPREKKVVQNAPKSMLRLAQLSSGMNTVLDPRQEMRFQIEVDSIFQKLVPGIIGLSVGANTGSALIKAFRNDAIIVSDVAYFKDTNTGRVELSYDDMVMSEAEIRRKKSFSGGQRNKAVVFAQQRHREGPYINIYAYQRTDKTNLANFLGANSVKPAVSFLIEVCDKLRVKLDAAIEARNQRMRLYRLSDVGTNCYIDIRPFDTDPNATLAVNCPDDVLFELLEDFEKTHTDPSFFALASALAGEEHLTDGSEFAALVRGDLPKLTTAIPQFGAAAIAGSGILTSMIARAELGQKYHERTIFDITHSKTFVSGELV